MEQHVKKKKKSKKVILILLLVLLLVLAVFFTAKYVIITKEYVGLKQNASEYLYQENLEDSLDRIKNADFVVALNPAEGGTKGKLLHRGHEQEDMVLDICRAVAEQNPDSRIAVVLTRNDDVFVSDEQRKQFLTEIKPDLFIDVSMNRKNKKELYGTVTSYQTDYFNHIYSNQQFADDMERSVVTEIKGIASGIYEVPEGTVPMLEGMKIPAVSIACGNLSDEAEAELFAKHAFREKVAAGILNGINQAYETLEDTES